MNILLTVCARGGSKGVKNKNIKQLMGEPLISHTIKVAKKWNKAAKIICSTDSDRIAEIAIKYGIKVPFMRPKELASDEAGKIAVIRHALLECERIYDTKYDVVVDLDVTSPIRTNKDLNKCLNIFKSKNVDVLLSVVEARKNPYFNMLEINKQGFAEISKKLPNKLLRRQDAPKVYSANASIYFYKRNFLLNEKNTSPLSSKKVAVYVMSEISAVDIDNELDFKFIEFLIKEKVVIL